MVALEQTQKKFEENLSSCDQIDIIKDTEIIWLKVNATGQVRI